MKKICFIIFTLIINQTNAQNKELANPEDFDTVMTLTNFWETIFSEDTFSVSLENVYVTTQDSEEYLSIRRGILKKKKIVDKKIETRNIYFKGYYHDFFGDYFSGGFNIDSTTFLRPVELDLNGIQGIYIQDCIFKNSARIEVDGKAWLGVKIENCAFELGYFFGVGQKLENESETSLRLRNSVFQKANWEWFNRFDNIYIDGCSFIDTNKLLNKSEGIYIQNSPAEIANFRINNSTFQSPIRAYDLGIKNHFEITNSNLSFIGINTFKLPKDIYEFRCKWKVIDSSIAYVEEYTHDFGEDGGFKTSYQFFNLYSDSSIIKEEVHDILKSKAYQILNIYKAQGDLKSYNACYRDIKVFENNRLKYEYKKNPTFEGWFHWKLNELISSYSDYGTNPAKAVIKSIWVILLFTFFYMFFPSEWDISSKAVIIANFKRIRDKNDKTASPIVKALAYIIVSFANALTLSINSFVTLGFGHIPTKGLARYFTIFQGFIGWFLLTIFSVSLISQVLN